MHLLVGFVIIVGLVAFAFGETTARYFVGTVLICVVAGAAAFIFEVLLR